MKAEVDENLQQELVIKLVPENGSETWLLSHEAVEHECKISFTGGHLLLTFKTRGDYDQQD